MTDERADPTTEQADDTTEPRYVSDPPAPRPEVYLHAANTWYFYTYKENA